LENHRHQILGSNTFIVVTLAGNANAGGAYKKALSTLIAMKQVVTASNAMSFSKGKTKLSFIGKGTAEKMKEFCETGTIGKLEEKRSLLA
jgi:DNA polymerase/3'-5' exonuclease PolX